MTATDFIDKSTWEVFRDVILKEKTNTTYQKRVTCGNNWYEINLRTGHARYTYEKYKYCSLNFDYNYYSTFLGHNCRGGDNFVIFYGHDVTTYEDFCREFNKKLEHYPDYEEPEFEQTSLF